MVEPSADAIFRAPKELADWIEELFPYDEWENAANIALLESGWNAFAENDTTDSDHPCGSVLRVQDGMTVTAEHSVGWFQINACNLQDGEPWYHLFNTRLNVLSAHALWERRGWSPWYFSAKQLGLL